MQLRDQGFCEPLFLNGHLRIIYLIELKVQDTTDTAMYTLYHNIHITIDNASRLKTRLHDNRYDLKFSTVNFPIICFNIPAAPAYGVYISMLIRNSRVCGSCHDFLDRYFLRFAILT